MSSYITGNFKFYRHHTNKSRGYDSDPIYETEYNKEITRSFCYYVDNIVDYSNAFHSIKNKYIRQ